MLIRSRVNERIVSRRPSFLPFLGLDSFMKFPVAVSVCVVYCYPLRPRQCSGWCVDNYCRAKLSPFHPPQSVSTLSLSLSPLPRSDFARYGKFVKCGGEKRKGAEIFSPPLSSTLSVGIILASTFLDIRRVNYSFIMIINVPECKQPNSAIQDLRRGMFFGGEDDFSTY